MLLLDLLRPQVVFELYVFGLCLVDTNLELNICLLQVLKNLKLVLSNPCRFKLLLDNANVFQVSLELTNLLLVDVLLLLAVGKLQTR